MAFLSSISSRPEIVQVYHEFLQQTIFHLLMNLPEIIQQLPNEIPSFHTQLNSIIYTAAVV